MGSYIDVADNVARLAVEFMEKFLQKKYREDEESLTEMRDALAKRIAKEIEPYCGP
jgi:hypothetical protein